MIPKIIHYCWFGGNPLPPLALKCISSWKKYCPDYEIKEWNESNYDFTKNEYMKQAYDSKKWGFVPDYARLDIVYNYGGIYLDTDVELVKSLDGLLNYKCYAGMEKPGKIALGLGFGAEMGCYVIKDLLIDYKDRRFFKSDGSLDLTPSPIIQTEFLNKYGLCPIDEIQIINDMTIFPTNYFNPMDMETGKINISESTYSIHHYAASWESKYNIFRGKVYKFINRVFGNKTAILAKKIFGRKIQ